MVNLELSVEVFDDGGGEGTSCTPYVIRHCPVIRFQKTCHVPLQRHQIAQTVGPNYILCQASVGYPIVQGYWRNFLLTTVKFPLWKPYFRH